MDLFRTKGVLAVQGMKEKFVFQADFRVMFGICKPCRVQSAELTVQFRVEAVHMAFNGAPQKEWQPDEEFGVQWESLEALPALPVDCVLDTPIHSGFGLCWDLQAFLIAYLEGLCSPHL